MGYGKTVRLLQTRIHKTKISGILKFVSVVDPNPTFQIVTDPGFVSETFCYRPGSDFSKCYGSGSDFQKVPDPVSDPTINIDRYSFSRTIVLRPFNII
jgi:hypothetical protein